MKCVVTDYVEPDLDWEARRYAEEGIEFDPRQLRRASDEETVAAIEDADVVVVDQRRLDGTLLRRAGRCRLVIRHGDGYDNLDLHVATELGIVCINKPGFWSLEVAEHAVVLILSTWAKLRRQIDVAAHADEASAFPWDLPSIYPVSRFRGSVVGIVGFGKIGRRVASLMRGLGAEVTVCDPYLPPETIAAASARPVSFHELIETADVVTLHTPSTPETRRMIDASVLERMKRSAIVVNTARGSVVDTDALVAALEAGAIAGAAVDVTEPEPLPPGHPLYEMDNVVVTPHLGWYSDQAMWEMRRSIVDDVLGVRDGRIPSTIVNPEVLESDRLRLKGETR